MVKIYILAGEASGDFIGARLIAALRQLSKEQGRLLDLRVVGGDQMQHTGAELFFHCDAIAVMGLAEIIPHYFRLKRLIRDTVDDIAAFAPDVLVTIDSSGFCNRVIDGLKQKQVSGMGEKASQKIHFIHYVAPPVWAWRPWRAKTLAKRVDHLLCLFPFEPVYFTCHGLKATFVGHPLVELDWTPPQQLGEQSLPNAPLTLCILPGSRSSEIQQHLPIFAQAVSTFHAVDIVVPTFDRFKADILAVIPSARVITDPKAKRLALMKSDVALATSGTVALELALARTPALIAFRTSALTAFLVKRLIKVSSVSLPNILLNAKVVPEYLQERCNAVELRCALSGLMDAALTLKADKRMHHERAEIDEAAGVDVSLAGRGGPLGVDEERHALQIRDGSPQDSVFFDRVRSCLTSTDTQEVLEAESLDILNRKPCVSPSQLAAKVILSYVH